MFARWLFVRMSAAEKALREGRLDDACAAAEQEEIRAHPRGARLLDDLVKPLVARARLHRQAGRFGAALADLDRLVKLGRGNSDVQALRQQIIHDAGQDAARVADIQQQRAEQRQAAGRAAAELAAGRLETMRLDLERVNDPQARADLGEELEARIRRSTQLLEQAGQAVERGDWLSGLRFWQEACQRCGRSRATDDFAARLAVTGPQALTEWVRVGRLDCLVGARTGLAALLPLAPTLTDFEKVVALCGRAAAQFAAADYTGLRQNLLRLKAGRGKVEWIDSALAALTDIAAAHETLLASPLGLYASVVDQGGEAGRWSTGKAEGLGGWGPARDGGRARRTTGTADGDVGRNGGMAAGGDGGHAEDPNAVRLDRPLLVLIDGGCSGLLVSGERVRLGRAGGSAGVEVALPCDAQSHHADIIRRGDDYFVMAYAPLEVNHRRVEHALLRDGDRIAVGGDVGSGLRPVPHAGAGRIVFAKPSAKSPSAVLRLSHRCRLAGDVSDVVLFRETCIVGPAASCHLRTHEGEVQLVLFERGGGLYVRQTAGNGWLNAPARAVAVGETLEFGEVRVTVRPYEA